jgi:hypothetical protein
VKIVIGVLAAAAVLAAAGCGKSESEKKAEAEQAQSGKGTITCEGSATTAKTGLPDGFPQPDAVTYVKASATGPTTIVDGYSTEDLEGMYVEYKDRLQEAGYTIEFSYKTGGANSTEGIVALRGGDSCDNGNVSIHITNRPSG